MKLIHAIGASSIISLFAVAAFAADAPPPPHGAGMAGACKQDIETLCPEAKAGEGRVAACLKTNFRQISPGCKAAIKASRAQHMHAAPGSPPPAPMNDPPPPNSPPSN